MSEEVYPLKALLVIDVQHGIVDYKDFSQEIQKIKEVILDFKNQKLPVIFMKHFDSNEESPLHSSHPGSEIYEPLKHYADYVLVKRTQSSFFQTELEQTLKELSVDHLFIVGFETEFCCLFTAIAAFDRGYKVTFIEDATGTINTDQDYEIPGLDIRDFVGTVLHWSGNIEVLDFEEYVEIYRN